MITIFLLAFILVLVLRTISSGEAYIYFSRFITYMNAVRDKSPRYATDREKAIEITYKVGKRSYGVIVLKRKPLNWVQAGVLKGGQWIDKTGKISHFAGPFKNFHGIALTPAHISPKYEKLALKFDDGAVIHIGTNEVIVSAVQEFYKKNPPKPKLDSQPTAEKTNTSANSN